MKKVTINEEKLYPYYYIDENPLSYKPTIELPENIIEDYKKVMGEFRRVQNALKELVGDKK